MYKSYELLIAMLAAFAVWLPFTFVRRTATMAFRLWLASTTVILILALWQCAQGVWINVGPVWSIIGLVAFIYGIVPIWMGYLVFHGELLEALWIFLVVVIGTFLSNHARVALRTRKAIEYFEKMQDRPKQ